MREFSVTLILPLVSSRFRHIGFLVSGCPVVRLSGCPVVRLSGCPMEIDRQIIQHTYTKVIKMASFQRGAKSHYKKSLNGGPNGGIVFQPMIGKHSATIIFIHGLGDSAEGLESIVEMWGHEFPQVKFILPSAGSMPVTVYGGMSANAWYDIASLDENSREQDPTKGIEESKTFIQTLMEEEMNRGILLSRILLMGFSQGGAMSLFTGLQFQFSEELLEKASLSSKYPKRCGGLLVLSGYLPKQHSFQLQPAALDTPVLHLHGQADPLVRFSFAEKTHSFLATEKGVKDYTLKGYPGVQHTLSMEMINDGKRFIQNCLSVNSNHEETDFLVKPRHPKDLSIKEIKEAIKENQLQGKIVGLSEKSEFVAVLTDFYEKDCGITCFAT
jgi:lysophospholipase-2